jgi:hypothetical protein
MITRIQNLTKAQSQPISTLSLLWKKRQQNLLQKTRMMINRQPRNTVTANDLALKKDTTKILMEVL